MTMDKGLLTQALAKFFLGVILLGLLLFLSAGSFRYWQGWLLMGILFVPMPWSVSTSITRFSGNTAGC